MVAGVSAGTLALPATHFINFTVIIDRQGLV
jgi:hypothetical protein